METMSSNGNPSHERQPLACRRLLCRSAISEEVFLLYFSASVRAEPCLHILQDALVSTIVEGDHKVCIICNRLVTHLNGKATNASLINDSVLLYQTKISKQHGG